MNRREQNPVQMDASGRGVEFVLVPAPFGDFHDGLNGGQAIVHRCRPLSLRLTMEFTTEPGQGQRAERQPEVAQSDVVRAWHHEEIDDDAP